jgi:FkbM family methyltransferase
VHAQPAELPTPSLQALKQRAHQLLDSQRSLQQQNHGLVAERLGIESERDQLVTQLQELSAERDALLAERDSLSAHLQEFTAQRDSIQQQWETLQARVEDLQGQLSAQSVQTAEQSQQREVLQGRVQELEVQLSAQSAQTAEQNQQLEELQGRVEDLQAQLSAQLLKPFCRGVYIRDDPQVHSELYTSSHYASVPLSEGGGEGFRCISLSQCKELLLAGIETILSSSRFEVLCGAGLESDPHSLVYKRDLAMGVSRYGAIFHYAEPDLIGRSLVRYGEWAHFEIETLMRLIGDGDCVLDVGSFIGTHALAFGKRVGPSGCVVAFEPNKQSFAILAMNTCTISRSNITPINIALGASCREVTSFVEQELNTGLSKIVESDGADCDHVDMKTLDSLTLVRMPSLIKIDVEGMEIDVLKGATLTIEKSRPFIFAEVNSVANGLKLLDWAREVGYICLGCSHAAFNPGNFLGDSENFLGSARECGLLMIADERIGAEGVQELITEGEVRMVADVDDLSHLMQTKPQYATEVPWH